MPITKKRPIAAAIGIVYAFIYGFWTMLLTGGGHGNFIWLGLFLFVEVFGLYFPLMSALAVDLRPWFAKIVFGSMIGFNLIASTIMILGWVNEPGVGERPSDFSRNVQVSGIESVVLWAFIHFLPTFIFAFLLTRSILARDSLVNEDRLASLNLS